MRKIVLLLAAGVLASCASTGPARNPSSPPPPAPVSPSPSAASEESIQQAPAAEEAPAPAADGALSLPSAPQRPQPAASADDISPPPTTGPAKFPMSPPQAPAPASPKAPQAASAPPKAAASSARSAAKTPAPAPLTPAAPAGSTAPPRAASAAATPAPAAPSSAVPGAAPAQSYGRLREVFARVGDDVQIGLDAPGFLFLGFPDRSPQGDGISFKGKDTREGKTWFTFRAVKLGTYDLDFLRQDNSTGTSSKETVRVHVVSDEDFSAAVAGGGTAPASPAAEAGDPLFADRLASLGQYDAAIAELLKGYREGDPQRNSRIAQLSMLTGSYDAAAKFYTKNLGAAAPWGDGAVIGLTRVAIAQKDQPELLSLLKKLLSAKDPGLEETLIAAARMERDRREVGVGIDLANEYVTRYPSGAWRDEADFILAQLLEADSPFRDIARARALYRGILDQHPASVFAPAARDRVEYIDRHFFQVR